MENVKWLFFDIGSTLIDESKCYWLRYREAVVGTTISSADFENKVIEFSKQNRKGDHEAATKSGNQRASFNFIARCLPQAACRIALS